MCAALADFYHGLAAIASLETLVVLDKIEDRVVVRLLARFVVVPLSTALVAGLAAALRTGAHGAACCPVLLYHGWLDPLATVLLRAVHWPLQGELLPFAVVQRDERLGQALA
jgi:hypothetical protein